MTTQCHAHSFTGRQCRLEDGHTGKHERLSYTTPEGDRLVFRWSDEERGQVAALDSRG